MRQPRRVAAHLLRNVPAERLEQRRVRGDVLVGVAHDAEQREEDRHLHQEREATRKRVDLVLLVELHHFFVELGAVVLVLRLELLDLRLRPLHVHHRLGLLGGEREEREHHHDREHDDGDAEVRDQAVEEREDRPEEVVDGIEEFHRESALFRHVWGRTWVERTFGSGTGSKPPGCHGWHRATRRMASQAPRRPPWRVSASRAYCEQDGWNRQRGGR